MKLSLSLTFGLISTFKTKWFLLLYLPGAIAGLAGVFSIAASDMSDSAMKLITGLFWGLAGMTSWVMIIVGITGWGGSDRGGRGRVLQAIIICIAAWGALYSDWVLVIVAQNGVAGYPYQALRWVKALWVLYYIGKRLTLFMP